MSSLSRNKKLRFLADENIKKELVQFIASKGFDIIPAPKRYVNGKLARISLSESRVMVTNDKHFSNPEQFPKERIFGVVWLRIPQDKPEALFNAFSKLLEEKSKPEDFEGFLIELEEGGKFKSSPLKSVKTFRFTK